MGFGRRPAIRCCNASWRETEVERMPRGGFLSRARACISRSAHNFSKEQTLFSLGAGVNPTEGRPTGSQWAEFCKRGHGQCGLPETGAESETHEQSKGAPVMCVWGDRQVRATLSFHHAHWRQGHGPRDSRSLPLSNGGNRGRQEEPGQTAKRF